LQLYGYLLTSDLETFPAMSTHLMNICDIVSFNRSIKYKDIASHEIGINGQRTMTDGRTTLIHYAFRLLKQLH